MPAGDSQGIPTQASDLSPAPEPVGHALPHPGAHQGVASVAGEDGSGPVTGEGPDLVPVGRRGQLPAGDN